MAIAEAHTTALTRPQPVLRRSLLRLQPSTWIGIWWLLFGGGSYALYHAAFPVRLLHHVILTAVLAVWLWREGLPRSALTLPLLASVGAALLSVPGAVDPRLALEASWHMAINALLLLWMLARSIDARSLTMPALALAASMLLEAVAGGARPAGLLLIPNLSAAALAVLLPSVVQRHGRIWGAVIMAALLVSVGRGALLGAGVGMLVYALLSGRSRRVALLLLVTGGALALIISTQPGRVSGDALRQALWSAALQMHADRPELGVGLGNFAAAAAGVLPPANNATGAHNHLLNLVAETGIAGAAAAAALVLTVIGGIPRRLTPTQRAALAGLVGAACILMTDNFPAGSWAVIIAALVATLAGAAGSYRAAGRVLAVLLLVAGGALLISDSAYALYLSGHPTAAAQLDPGWARLYLAEPSAPADPADNSDITLFNRFIP